MKDSIVKGIISITSSCIAVIAGRFVAKKLDKIDEK